MTIKVTKPAVNLREELTDLKQPYPIQGSVDGNDVVRERLGIENHDQLTIGTDGVIDNFTSTGIDDNATSTAITIDSSENVGIGTPSTSVDRMSIQGSDQNGGTLVVSNDDSSGTDGLGWTARSNRMLTSNGIGWESGIDGKDPIIVIGSSKDSDHRNTIGLALHNESNGDNTFSPGIMFTNKSNSSSYNTAYASILGKKTGQGSDANWSTGEIHMDTAGTRSGSNSRTFYMDDNPAFKIDNAGDISTPYISHAYGNWSGSSFSITNNTGWQMNVLRSQNMTYTNHASHGYGMTINKAGLYILNSSALYNPGGSYVYIGWCINGSQQHHWHSNHEVLNNHDYVSPIARYLNIGDHVTFENSSSPVTTVWGGTHSTWYIVKVG